MGLNVRAKFEPEAEVKLAIPDRDTAERLVDHLGIRENWHEQTTLIFDHSNAANGKNPLRLGFAAHGAFLKSRQITNYADTPRNREEMNDYHLLTMKVEDGIVPVEMPGMLKAGVHMRVELSVDGLHAHDPDPVVIDALFRKHQIDLLQRRQQAEDTSIANRLSQCFSGLPDPDNLRALGAMSARRYDGHIVHETSLIAGSVDLASIRTPDIRKKADYELELELVMPHTDDGQPAYPNARAMVMDNPGYIAYAMEIADRFNLQIQLKPKAQRVIEFLLEGQNIIGRDGKIGILWEQAAERRGEKFRDRPAYEFLVHG